MQCTHPNHHGRRCSACSLRPLPEMCEASYDELDVEALAGDNRARLERLSYAYLSRGYVPGEAGYAAFRDVYKSAEALSPDSCPLLLLWRIWWQNRTSTLACAAVRPPAPRPGTVSHKAMATWSCVHWRDRARLCAVCMPIYAQRRLEELRAQQGTGDTCKQASWHRYDLLEAHRLRSRLKGP